MFYMIQVSVVLLLFVIMLLVEFLLNNSTGIGLLSDLYLYAVAKFDRGINKSYGTALFNRNESVAGGHSTYRHTIFEDSIAMTGHSLVVQFDTTQPLLYTFCLLTDNGILTDKFLFVELAEHRQTSHYGRDVL